MSLIIIDPRCRLAIDPDQVVTMHIQRNYPDGFLHITLRSGEEISVSRRDANNPDMLDLDAAYDKLLMASTRAVHIDSPGIIGGRMDCTGGIDACSEEFEQLIKHYLESPKGRAWLADKK